MVIEAPFGGRSRRQFLAPPYLRQLHIYLGMFIAPSLLFFACTGALQLFSLHEAHGAYQPPPLLEKLGKLHKDQVFALKAKKPDAAAPAATPAAARDDDHDDDHDHDHADHDHHDQAKPTVLALKWFFAFVAADLVISTLLGVWMGLRYSRNKGLAWVLLIAGAAIPTVLALV